MRHLLLALSVALALPASRVDVRAQTPGDDVQAFLHDLESIVQTASATRYLALVADSADRTRAQAFAEFELVPGATRVVIQERDREALPGALAGNGYRVVVDAFLEFGGRARVVTWRIDLKRAGADLPLRIVEHEQITSVEGLYRLALNPGKQFDARDLTISVEDLDLSLPSGAAFVAEIDQGVTALVLIGHGEMRFHPRPETERGQVKIFCGRETLDASFDAVFVRINPNDFEDRVAADRLRPAPVDPRAFKRAADLFRDESSKSFVLDLGDLSREPWSLLPSVGDFLADVRTRRVGTLTYARSLSEAEDITVFDRKRHKNIAVYASAEKLARRGRFYNEDDLAEYDVLDYNIDLAIVPERQWLEGRAGVRLRVRSVAAGTLTLRLAEPLVVRSIVSDRFGRLFNVRVRNQNSVVINLPTSLSRDSELTLTVSYSGRLEPQTPDREAAQGGQGPQTTQREDFAVVSAEPSLLYSNRSYWYPQSTVSDYATATMRISVPPDWDCVASGDLASGSPTLVAGKNPGQGHKAYLFKATQPVRYLGFVVSHFVRSDTATIALARDAAGDGGSLPTMPGASYDSVNLSVEANPRQASRGHGQAALAAEIMQFYTSLIGDCPYPSLTLALLESDRPGGHSPAYFAALNEPVLMTPLVWRNDPESFNSYPEFFLAHEIAHQWWGQGVGWRNYHEQWLSESFAQYFAALYAQRSRGDDVFVSVLRQLRKWGIDESPQGPVYLGYRLGHLRSEPRVFSALVYNKGAAVLHMLRRLVGDEAFFRGLRRFYRTWRFQKAGTDDFRVAMETESKRSLDRFFERWIYGSTLPTLTFSYRVEGNEVVLHIEQVGNELFDVPVTVTLDMDRAPRRVTVVVPVTERVGEMRVPLTGRLRSAEISKDDGTLAEIRR